MSDLSNEANYRFKGSMRDVVREMDEYTEVLKTPSDWDAAAARLQERVAAAVSDVFLDLDRGAETIRAAVMDLLAEEDLALPATSRGPGRRRPCAVARPDDRARRDEGRPARRHRADRAARRPERHDDVRHDHPSRAGRAWPR